MMQAFKDILQSKKFWYAVVGSAASAALNQLGVSHDIINIVGGLTGATILGQGMADFKKNSK